MKSSKTSVRIASYDLCSLLRTQYTGTSTRGSDILSGVLLRYIEQVYLTLNGILVNLGPTVGYKLSHAKSPRSLFRHHRPLRTLRFDIPAENGEYPWSSSQACISTRLFHVRRVLERLRFGCRARQDYGS